MKFTKNPILTESKLLSQAMGLSAEGLGKAVGLCGSYTRQLLLGAKAYTPARWKIEQFFGKPIWSSSDEFELVRVYARDIPDLVYADKEKLRAACLEAGFRSRIRRPGANRMRMLAALHAHFTKQNTHPDTTKP